MASQLGNDFLSYNMSCAYIHVRFFFNVDRYLCECVSLWRSWSSRKKKSSMQMEKTCSFMKKMGLFSFGCIAYIVVSLIFIVEVGVGFFCCFLLVFLF